MGALLLTLGALAVSIGSTIGFTLAGYPLAGAVLGAGYAVLAGLGAVITYLHAREGN